jgi:hypothetical protein
MNLPPPVEREFQDELDTQSTGPTLNFPPERLRTGRGFGHSTDARGHSALTLKRDFSKYPTVPIAGSASVVSGEFNSSNSLILTLSDGSTINCGPPNGVTGSFVVSGVTVNLQNGLVVSLS